MNRGNDSISECSCFLLCIAIYIILSKTTFLFKLNGSLGTVIEDGEYPFALFSLRCGINRDPSTSDSRFDAPNALDRALRLSKDLSLNDILNFVDKSVRIRVTF